MSNKKRKHPLADQKAVPRIANVRKYADELAELYREYGSLDPEVALKWAADHPGSALHNHLTWDDGEAAHQWRLQQMRQLINSVEVVYPDGTVRQVYASLYEQRGRGGYTTLVDVMSDAEKRARFLEQALTEYRRLGEKYNSLQELAEVRATVERVSGGRKRRKAA